MNNKNAYFISEVSQLTYENLWEMGASLYAFQNDRNNEKTLIFLLESLLNGESYVTEVFSVQIGSDIDNSNQNYIVNMKTKDIISIEYDNYSVVMPQNLGIQFIIDYCKKFSTSKEVEMLCLKLMKKFQVTYNKELSELVSLSDTAWIERNKKR